MIVYVCPPMDHNWENLKSVTEYAQELGARDAAIIAQDGEKGLLYFNDTVGDFLKEWEKAKTAAYEHGWEGDFRQGPGIFWLPDETGFIYGFVFKQDNNGTTYVISPKRLHWIEEFAD